MFGMKHNECVGFESRWRVKKVSSVEATQTSEFSTKEMETSTSEQKDVEVQTVEEPTKPKYVVDEEKLAQWLKRIYPSVKKELDDSANSRAFRGYKLATDSSDANCRLVQTVDASSLTKDATIGSIISALSWNSTNKTLAVSCTYKHSSWCYHEGVVLIYTLNRDDNLPETPRIKLCPESCVNDVKFHSLLPAILAGGLFSGAIIIWNIQNEEEQIIAKFDGHGDAITQLNWIIDINAPKNFILASSGLDGLLSLWNFDPVDSAFSLKERHQIRCKLFPKMESSEETIKKIERGVTCFDFSRHSPEMFIVGAEGGLVVQCSLLGTTKLHGSREVPLLDSTVKYHEPHKGDVTSVSFSPNRKEMFMTYGTDMEIRIYLIEQEEPAQTIFVKQALNTVSWVPFEERIICGCAKNGIEIFDLKKGKALENTTKEKVKTQTLTQIAINNMKSNIVAVASDNGQIQMWRVPWALFGNMTI